MLKDESIVFASDESYGSRQNLVLEAINTELML